MSESRIATGITGLDEILHGGLIPSSSYLIVGEPGTGKTILSLQFMNECAKRKSKCLYITFAEPEGTIRKNAASFGWDLSKVTFEDFTLQTYGSKIHEEYTVFPPNEVEKEPIWKRIYQAIDEHEPTRLVIDSATFLRYLSTDDYQYRKHVQNLINHLAQRKCLSLLLFEPSELEKENALALSVDGVIHLCNDISQQRVIEIRTIMVTKMRGSSYLEGRHPLRITTQGITVWPHHIAKLKRYSYKRKTIASGIENLDEMLMGGFHSGTCNLISGPSGVGKSTLGMQFLVEAAKQHKIRSAIYSFEEGLSSLLERCSSISIPLEKLVEDGSIVVREINPLEFYPDELLDIIRNDVEKDKRDLFVLDNLRGYNLAMEQFGNLTANIQNIVNFIRSNRASIFLVNEQEKLTGDLQITDIGVSYLCDNVLLLRYAEFNGEVIKVINCLKKRMGNYQPELRQMKITEKGIWVGKKLSHLQGVLTGVPQAYTEGTKPTL